MLLAAYATSSVAAAINAAPLVLADKENPAESVPRSISKLIALVGAAACIIAPVATLAYAFYSTPIFESLRHDVGAWLWAFIVIGVALAAWSLAFGVKVKKAGRKYTEADSAKASTLAVASSILLSLGIFFFTWPNHRSEHSKRDPATVSGAGSLRVRRFKPGLPPTT